MVRILSFLFIVLMLNSLKATAQLNLKPVDDTLNKKISLKVLPQNFYTEHIGFFCKKEVQVQKMTKLPFYFRLGSIQYTDYLERKPNTFIGRKTD